MIKFDFISVDSALAKGIIPMRNSYSNWEKSDSNFNMIGENDLKLLKSLVKAGDSHSKCLRLINVTMDITAPLYWWKQFDTYKVGTVCVSTSTMHTITKRPFNINDFSKEHIENARLSIMYEICDILNSLRELYIDKKDKKYWYGIIQLLPESYNQMRTVQLNYQTILNIIKQRKDHKLDEWHDFIEEMYKLPYIKELSEV